MTSQLEALQCSKSSTSRTKTLLKLKCFIKTSRFWFTRKKKTRRRITSTLNSIQIKTKTLTRMSRVCSKAWMYWFRSLSQCFHSRGQALDRTAEQAAWTKTSWPNGRRGQQTTLYLNMTSHFCRSKSPKRQRPECRWCHSTGRWTRV